MAKRGAKRFIPEEENFVDDLMHEGSATDSYQPNRLIQKKSNKENNLVGKYIK